MKLFRTLSGFMRRPPHVKRHLVLVQHDATEAMSAEVEDVKERYSAKRYVLHLKAAMAGDHRGRGEWSRYIRNLSPDDYRAFFWDVDQLIEAGELVYVLTPEEEEAKKQRVLDNIDHWRDEASRIGKDWGINPAAMHKLMSVTHAADKDGDFALSELPQVTEEDLLAVSEEEAEAWLEGAQEDDDE